MPTLTPEQVEDAARVMPDHVLATSFMEPDARARVIALILFAHEIGRARAVVSEAGLAAIRLQWWRDTIDQIYTGKVVRAQPTTLALAAAIQEANLPRALFDAMIEGHEQELVSVPFTTLTDLSAYLDATFGNLNRLSLLASGMATLTTHGDGAARFCGIAWGLSHLLLSLPNYCLRRCSWLPKDMTKQVDQESMFAGQVSTSLRAALLGILEEVSAARAQANWALKDAQLGGLFPALAHASLARRYGKASVPAIGETWMISPGITLLERQARIVCSVAFGRV